MMLQQSYYLPYSQLLTDGGIIVIRASLYINKYAMTTKGNYASRLCLSPIVLVQWFLVLSVLSGSGGVPTVLLGSSRARSREQECDGTD